MRKRKQRDCLLAVEMRIHNSKWQTNLRQTYYLSTAKAARCLVYAPSRGRNLPLPHTTPKQATVDVHGAATPDKNNPGQSCSGCLVLATWALANTLTHRHTHTCTLTARAAKTMQLRSRRRRCCCGA